MTRSLRLLSSFGLFAFCAAAGQVSAQTATPYAGEERREIKALSVKEIDDLVQGRGMGLAKAAELNRYPGPSHALELADQLELTASQRERLTASMARMTASAKETGLILIALERELDAAFAGRSITPQRLAGITSEIGAKQGLLRAVHLVAHLETTSLLTPAQIARYDILRGYAQPPAKAAHGSHEKH